MIATVAATKPGLNMTEIVKDYVNNMLAEM